MEQISPTTEAAKKRTFAANSMASEVAHDLFTLGASLGIERSTLITVANLEAALFDDPDARIPYPQAIRLWSHLCQVRPHLPLGVLLGQQSTSGWGALAMAAKHAASGTEALQLIVTFSSVVTTGGRLHVDQEGDLTRIIIHHLPEVEELAHPIDYGITMLCRLLVGDEFRGRLARAQCKHQPLGPEDNYKQIFGIPFQFGAPFNALWLKSDDLNAPRAGGDSRVVHYLRAYLEAEVARLPGPPLPFLLQMEHAVKELASERCFQANAIAARMGLSLRSLQRRAAAEGLQVSTIIENARQELATALLINSQDSIASIAEQLEYSDERSFSRAFLRWTGTTASLWRKNALESRKLES